MKVLYIAVLFLLIFLCVRVFNKYKNLTRVQSYTEVDHLGMMLGDAKTHLPPGAVVGFTTNTSADRRLVLYFKTALVLAPVVVELADRDTMLLIQERQLPDLSSKLKKCILSGENRDFKYSLVCVEH